MEGIRNGCLVTIKKLSATFVGSGAGLDKHQVMYITCIGLCYIISLCVLIVSSITNLSVSMGFLIWRYLVSSFCLYIQGNFRGYKCSCFSLIKHVPRTFYTHEFNTTCMHACKRLFRENLSKGLSTKVYTHENYPLYGTHTQKKIPQYSLGVSMMEAGWALKDCQKDSQSLFG